MAKSGRFRAGLARRVYSTSALLFLVIQLQEATIATPASSPFDSYRNSRRGGKRNVG